MDGSSYSLGSRSQTLAVGVKCMMLKLCVDGVPRPSNPGTWCLLSYDYCHGNRQADWAGLPVLSDDGHGLFGMEVPRGAFEL